MTSLMATGFLNSMLSVVTDPARRVRRYFRFRRQLRPSDVFLVGHPKSGNTWFAYMIASIIYHESLRDIHIANLADYIPYIHGRDWLVREFKHLRDPRVFRTEDPKYPRSYPRAIYLIRDPRSVLVSYWHHYRVVSGQDIAVDGFVSKYLDGSIIAEFEPWLMRWDWQASWWARRMRDPSVLVVRYEDMLADRAKILRKALDFLGLNCSETAVAEVVEKGSFVNMKKDEVLHGAESFPGELGKRGAFVRKGLANGWREELSPDSQARICSEFAAGMKEFGYLV